MAVIGGNITSSSDTDEQLIASIANGDLDAFKVALSAGADPNLIYPGSPDPIVFPLAADGRLEWVEALIATGRCDVTSIGSSGFRASHAPGVTARFFAPTGPDYVVEKFTKIALMLRNEEIRQLRAKTVRPDMTA